MILLGVAAVAGLIVTLILAERKRRRLLAAWATKHGLSAYDPGPEMNWLSDFAAWGPGYGHRAFDGYQGTVNGIPVRMFQHQSRTRSKDSENIHNFTVVCFDAPFAAPRLRITREHWGHKLVDAFGGEDIDFESDEFSRRFWVKCKNRRFAYDIIHPRMMEWLLTAPKTHWEWQGTRLVLHVGGSIRPKRAEPLLMAGQGFLARVPAHVQRS